MVVTSSGPLSLAAIAQEFNDSVPYYLTDYYRGGSFVPSIGANSGASASGPIGMTGLYGSRKGVAGSTSTYSQTGFTMRTGPRSLGSITIPAGVAVLKVYLRMTTSTSTGPYPGPYVFTANHSAGSYSFNVYPMTSSTTQPTYLIYSSASPNLSSNWSFAVNLSIDRDAYWVNSSDIWATYVS